MKQLKLTEYYQGNDIHAYEIFGAHLCVERNKKGVRFTTYAPHAQSVQVIGSFNDWSCEGHEMKRKDERGVWSIFIAGVCEGDMYKYRVTQATGRVVDKMDPYAFYSELRPNTASIVADLDAMKWSDQKWLDKRSINMDKPLNIYEMHLGSWKKNSDQEWVNYAEIADELIAYLKAHYFTHVELMPLNEYPFDGSWGYQCSGYFSATSRYGSVRDLQTLINKLHKANIGVIMDFVPVHFAVDHYALSDYDGTALYEYPHQDVGVSEWGSCNFMHSRGEVRSFLQSAANYWLSVYHVDGIRMDAISRIIYWQGEPARGVNNNAVDFIREMNRGLKTLHPTVMLSAEDSTSFEGVTKPADQGGLGFDYKWDMGWMNDTLDYFRTAPEYRSRDYHKLTFSMMYYYNDDFLLPLSHDEVVHGKATIAQKMYGEYEEKFPQARAFYMYMYAHPGKKLNFMGNEIGQLREWDEKREQDWDILKYPIHDTFHHFMQELNHLYLTTPALSAKDYENAGFQWLDCHQEERCIYAFERTDGKDRIVAVFNFSDEDQKGYELPITDAKELEVILASDDVTFGGSKKYTKKKVKVTDGKAVLDLSAYSAVYFGI